MSCEQFDTNGTYERYLAGGLTEPEREAFELHYFECGRCFDALRVLRATRAALRAGGAPATLPLPVFRRRGALAAIGLAAALFAGSVAVLTTRHMTSVPLQTATVEAPAPPHSDFALEALMDPPSWDSQTLRGVETAPTRRFEAVMKLYAARDFFAAANALREVLAADPASLDARYFLGICDLLTGNTDPGI